MAGIEEIPQRKRGAISHFDCPSLIQDWHRKGSKGQLSGCLFIFPVLLFALLLALLFHKLLKNPGSNNPELFAILRGITLSGLGSRQPLPILEVILVDNIALIKSN